LGKFRGPMVHRNFPKARFFPVLFLQRAPRFAWVPRCARASAAGLPDGAYFTALPGQLKFDTSSGWVPVKAAAAVALPRSWYSSQAVA
jgi:hypothetical protein